MAHDPEELARKLGIRHEHGDMRSDIVGPVTMDVSFARPDWRTNMVSEDGATRVPIGMPIEYLREQFGGNKGTLRDPLGNDREVEIPEHLPNGKDIYVQVTYRFKRRSRMKKG